MIQRIVMQRVRGSTPDERRRSRLCVCEPFRSLRDRISQMSIFVFSSEPSASA
jgi:hypothetical protein